MSRIARRLGALAATTLVAAAYVRWYRPWQLTWGATPEEVARPLPGDDLVTRPTFDATRAVTIAAPPADVWPWLVQVGVGRGGWYSYDLLDNLGRPSATTVHPEWQTLALGDLIPMSPDGQHGTRVHAMNPPHSMVWRSNDGTSWAWQLDALPGGATRVLTRIRSRVQPTPLSVVFAALLEFGDVWMLRKMLLTVRDRAEQGSGANA